MILRASLRVVVGVSWTQSLMARTMMTTTLMRTKHLLWKRVMMILVARKILMRNTVMIPM